MGWGHVLRIIGPRDIVTSVPPMFDESTQVKLSFFVDFTAFISPKRIFHLNADKKASASASGELHLPDPYHGPAPVFN